MVYYTKLFFIPVLIKGSLYIETYKQNQMDKAEGVRKDGKICSED